MRKIALTLLALISLLVLMVPLAQATEPSDEGGPTSLEIWLEIDSITVGPWDDYIGIDFEARVCIMNVGEHVANIGWVWIYMETKAKQEPWTLFGGAGQLQIDHFIDPGQKDEVQFVFGMAPLPDAKAFRLLAEVDLFNHPTGLRTFHYRQSFELPEM
jgi:hypothetical protein